MLRKIIGKAPVDYVSKKTGQQVIGAELHVIRPATDWEKTKGHIGEVCESVFTRLDTSKLEVGKSYTFNYEQNGRFADLVSFS
jgi:hypothetical protein